MLAMIATSSGAQRLRPCLQSLTNPRDTPSVFASFPSLPHIDALLSIRVFMFDKFILLFFFPGTLRGLLL